MYPTIASCVVVQSPSRVQLFAILWTKARQASLSLTTSWSSPKFMSIAIVMPSSHLILWHPLFLLPSIFPSIRSFPMGGRNTRLAMASGLGNSIKLRALLCKAIQDRWVIGEFWQNVIHWRSKWQTTPVYLPLEPHEHYKKHPVHTLNSIILRSNCHDKIEGEMGPTELWWHCRYF